MRTLQSTLLRGSGIAVALTLPGQALAGWGDENWGTMLWGLPLDVPNLPGFGLIALAIGLSATAAWTLRKRRPGLGLTLLLVLVAVPLVVAAGTLTVPNTFTNGTVADADEVNANFGSVKAAVDDNDGRITINAGGASAAQSTANAAVLDAAAAQGTADTAVLNAATAQSTANSALATADAAAAVSIASASVNSAGVLELTLSDGTVLNAGTVSAASDPAVAQRAWNSAIWGPFPNGGVWQ